MQSINKMLKYHAPSLHGINIKHVNNLRARIKRYPNGSVKMILRRKFCKEKTKPVIARKFCN